MAYVNTYIIVKLEDIKQMVREIFGPQFTVLMTPQPGNLGAAFYIQGPGIASAYYPNPGPMNYAWFNVHETPACCGTFFLSALTVEHMVKRQGYGLKTLELVKRIAKNGNFSGVIGIIPNTTSYMPARNAFTKAGWVTTTAFDVHNKRSGNPLQVWMLKVNGS